MAETTCPVFRPTEQEFKSFRRYIEDVVDPIAGKAGLCKVIPPPGWAARRRDAAEEMCKSVHIPAPIRQCVSSTRSNGVYSVDVVENPPMSLAEFKEYADKRAPFPSSTATAGFAGSAAVGVRRGRSGGDADGGKGGGAGGGAKCARGNGGRGYGGGYGFGGGGSSRSGSGGPTGRTGARESEVARRVRMFWRSLGPNSEAPVYGADTLGTLFSADDNDAWNVGKLDTILQLLKANLPGITTAMLYAGMWRSMFAFHVEDVNLYSINYLHRGDPKSWYGIPPDSRQRFESLAQAFFTEEFRACKDHMRHKTTMISPLQIQKAGIAYCTAVQEAGEFMITFPGSYHGGFNHGFNLAESTNFALDRWIRQGRGAGYCRCSPHSVRIDVDRFETLVRQHRRIAGKEATCLNGLAEGPPGSLLPDGGASDETARTKEAETKAITTAAPPAEEAAAVTSTQGSRDNTSVLGRMDAGSSSSDEDDTDDEEEERKRREEVEEDIQVFHCVCSNARSVRRVQRTDNGASFIPLPSPVPGKSLQPWPEESKCSECPRCGVWGHKACLEYVVPAQFAIPDRGIGANLGAAPTPVWVGGGESDPRVGAIVADADAALEGQQGASVTSTTGPENGLGVTTAAAISGGGSASAAAPPPAPPPRPVCWMCMQEQEEVTAMEASKGGAGGMAAAAPRRPGKSSGGSTSGVGGGGGGGGRSSSSSGGASSTVGSPGRENGSSNSSGGSKKGAKKRAVKSEDRKGGKKTRVGEGGGVSNGGGGGGSGGGTAAGRKTSLEGSAGLSSAVVGSSAAPGGLKRARVGPKLIGKEVLVSDGVAAVLTGVVTQIEAGQARVHYRGRNAKLDEWIDVRSERFLSTAEAKKQIELTQLAMNPSGTAVPASPTGASGKKRKATGGGESTGAEGKRAKKAGGKGVGDVKVKTEKGCDTSTGKTQGDGAKTSSPVKPKKKKKHEEVAGKKSAVSKKVAKKTAMGEEHGHGGSAGGSGKAAAGKTEEVGREKPSSLKVKGKLKVGKVKVGKVPEANGVGGSKMVVKSSRSDGKVKKVKNGSGGVAQAEGGVGIPKKESGSKGTLGKTSIGGGGGGSGKTKAHKEKKKKKKVKSEEQEKQKTKKPPAVKPVTITPPVFVQKPVPEHHVISNRRAAVLARTFAKETEEAQKDFQEAIAAAERSRIARKHRAKSPSFSHGLTRKGTGRGPGGGAGVGGGNPSGGSGKSAKTASAIKPVRRASAGDPPPGSALENAAAMANTGERWPDLGFVGQPWGRGPFHREMDESGGEEDDEEAPSPPSSAGIARRPMFSALASPGGMEKGAPPGSGATTHLHGDFQRGGQGGARLPQGATAAAAVAAAATLGVGGVPSRPRKAPKEMRRARVEAGEAVELGEEGAFRAWLTRLRAVQDIPVGHVEVCSRSLSVLLGTSPPDGSIRACVRALLVAETLRGGASYEVATFVRSLAGLLADAASKARPLQAGAGPAECTPPKLNAGYRDGDQLSTESRNAPAAGAPALGGTAGGPRDGSSIGGSSGGNDGDNAPPPPASIRDTEGAAAYAHALTHVARSRSKQKRATAVAEREKSRMTAAVAAAARVLADAQGNSGKKGKKTKKEAWAMRQHLDAVEAVEATVLPASRVPAPVVAGSVPGEYPFSRSGGELLLYAKAMVGLKRSHRWVNAWLEAPLPPPPPPPPPEAVPAVGSNRPKAALVSGTSGGSSGSSSGGGGGGGSGGGGSGGGGGSSSSGAVDNSSSGRQREKKSAVAAAVKVLTASATPPPLAPSVGDTEPPRAAAAAHTSPLVAAAAAACASASAPSSHQSPPVGAAAPVLTWQNTFRSLPPHASLRAAVLSSTPAMAMGAYHYPTNTTAATSSAAGVVPGASLPILHPRPYIHEPYGALNAAVGSAAAYRSGMLSLWPPQQAATAAAAAAAAAAAVATVGTAGTEMTGVPSPSTAPSAVPALVAAPRLLPAGGAKNEPVDLLERWARVGAVSVAPAVQGPATEEEEVVVDD